jgi:hypothetical protein
MSSNIFSSALPPWERGVVGLVVVESVPSLDESGNVDVSIVRGEMMLSPWQKSKPESEKRIRNRTLERVNEQPEQVF